CRDARRLGDLARPRARLCGRGDEHHPRRPDAWGRGVHDGHGCRGDSGALGRRCRDRRRADHPRATEGLSRNRQRARRHLEQLARPRRGARERMNSVTRQIGLSAPWLDEREEELALEVMRSGRLSLGPSIDRFEELLAAAVGAPYAAAVSSGTAGLHLLCHIAGISPGDEVITSPYSFVASANCAIYERATPPFPPLDPP